MKINKELFARMRALKSSASVLYRSIEEQQDAGWIVSGCVAGAATIILLAIVVVR